METNQKNHQEKQETRNKKKMMNFVSLGLIFTSLFTSAILSPIPANQNQQIQNQEEVIHHVPKQGLSTVITVQYEKDGPKISISTTPPPIQEEEKTDDDDDIIEVGAKNTQFHRAKELICDAYGKCKHKVLGAKDKLIEAEEKVGEKAHDAKECAQRTFKTAVDTGKTLEGDVRRNVSEDLDIVRRHVAEKAKQGVDTVETASGAVKDVVDDKVVKAKLASEKVKNIVGGKAREGLEAVQSAAETVKDKAKDGLEATESAAGTVKDKAESAVETMKDKAKGGLETVTDARAAVQDKAEQGLETVEAGADKVKHMVQDKFKQTVAANPASLETRRMSDVIRAYVGTLVSMGSLLGVIHLLGFAMAYGMSVWITFVSSYVLAGALPRQQFGMVQSKIYPLYFRAMAYSIGVALVGHILSQWRRRHMSENKAETFQGYNLIASLLMVFANLFYLEPRATKVMYERMKVEKEEGRGEDIGNDGNCVGGNDVGNVGGTTRRMEMGRLNETLKKMNSISSTLNILTLTSLTWHLVYLGQCLHMTTACH